MYFRQIETLQLLCSEWQSSATRHKVFTFECRRVEINIKSRQPMLTEAYVKLVFTLKQR